MGTGGGGRAEEIFTGDNLHSNRIWDLGVGSLHYAN